MFTLPRNDVVEAVRTAPPFRADHVGSLLRPQALVHAREQFEVGALSAEQLRSIEDDAIRQVVAMQEAVGLQGVTDGEFRRKSWHLDFLQRIGGVTAAAERIVAFHSREGTVPSAFGGIEVTGKLTLREPIFADHFRFLASAAKATPKVSIPGPSNLHRQGYASAMRSVYSDPEEYSHDISGVYADEIAVLRDLGCTYLQLDDTAFAGLNDPTERDRLRTSGIDPEKLHLLYIRLVNDALANKPTGMTVCVHSCRGNHRSMWRNSGGYDYVAESVFNTLDVTGFFLEYDDERSGGFEPLRFIPPNKLVVLGLVTTKRGTLESKDALKRRIDEAAKFVPLDQICLSPQCGFASTVLGNELTVEEQTAKLRLIVETANDVWG